MPKYGDIIKQAKSVKPEDQKTRKPDNQIKKARKAPQNSKPDNQISVNPDSQTEKQLDEPMKNLCVKVPESWRRHWAAQAKLTGRTMTDVMVEALKHEFGLPANQMTR